MKRFFVILAAVLLLASPSARANDFATGEDWTHRMSVREKYMSLIPPAVLFSEYDVHLRLSLPQYIFLIDQVMLRNPRLADEEVANIFASTIYLFEPQNRPALMTMEVNFLKGDFNAPALDMPRLTIEDILGEVVPEPEA